MPVRKAESVPANPIALENGIQLPARQLLTQNQPKPASDRDVANCQRVWTVNFPPDLLKAHEKSAIAATDHTRLTFATRVVRLNPKITVLRLGTWLET